jgi:hypothetical protein
MALLAVSLAIRLSDDENVEIDAVRLHGSIEKRHVTVVMRKRYGEFWVAHLLLLYGTRQFVLT